VIAPHVSGHRSGDTKRDLAALSKWLWVTVGRPENRAEGGNAIQTVDGEERDTVRRESLLAVVSKTLTYGRIGSITAHNDYVIYVGSLPLCHSL
jgi:hypothetical protein